MSEKSRETMVEQHRELRRLQIDVARDVLEPPGAVARVTLRPESNTRLVPRSALTRIRVERGPGLMGDAAHTTHFTIGVGHGPEVEPRRLIGLDLVSRLRLQR
jgi:2-polyprenyl-6-methoxyphenol hydroxylase-like FAD-dependent oxidoreductase